MINIDKMTVTYYDSLEQYVITSPTTKAYAIPSRLNQQILNILSNLLPSESYIDYGNGKLMWIVDKTKQVLIYELLLDITVDFSH